MTGSDFRGIPTDAVEFYRELRADNTKVWWAANKQRYDGHVREPLTHLVDLLAELLDVDATELGAQPPPPKLGPDGA